MKHTILQLFIPALLVPVLSGQVFEDDFNDGNDSGWDRYSPLEDLGAPVAFTFPGGNSYRFEAPASPNAALAGAAREVLTVRMSSMRPSGWKSTWWTGTMASRRI